MLLLHVHICHIYIIRVHEAYGQSMNMSVLVQLHHAIHKLQAIEESKNPSISFNFYVLFLLKHPI